MDVAGILLTGGASRRMGRDKATLPGPGGRTLASFVAGLLSVVATGPVVEVGPGASGLGLVTREDPPGEGPLAGVAAGAAALRAAGWEGPALVVAVDLPLLTEGVLRWLADHPHPGTVAPEVDGIPQPLCARWSAAALSATDTLLAAGTRKAAIGLAGADDLLADGGWHEVAPRDALADVDSPEDLARLPAEVRRPTTAVRVVRVDSTADPVRHADHPDRVATEEPLEIKAGGPGQADLPVAVTMRTPGHDFELAAGFLHAEGLVPPGVTITSARYCRPDPGEPQRFNIVTVRLDMPFTPPQARATTVSASCGVCGRTSIDDLVALCPPLPDRRPGAAAFDPAVLASLPDRVRGKQAVFDQTGGLHAAGLCTAGGEVLIVREDVGRHNAVDKVVGHELLAGRQGRLGRDDLVLVVSGRVSFEIVQKAAMAGIGAVVAVSAPTSLAVEAAERLGVTLAGFVRDGRLNVYAHPERITPG